MRLVLVTAPAEEPVTATEVKLFTKIEVDTDDALITRQIKAARRQVEQSTGLALITQTFDWYLDGLPGTWWWYQQYPYWSELRLPRAPLQTITSITSITEAGVSSVLAASSYRVSVGDGRVVLTEAGAWPTEYRLSDGVVIRFVAGFGLAAAVPEDLKEAVLRRFARIYRDRGDEERVTVLDPALADIESNYQTELV